MNLDPLGNTIHSDPLVSRDFLSSAEVSARTCVDDAPSTRSLGSRLFHTGLLLELRFSLMADSNLYTGDIRV